MLNRDQIELIHREIDGANTPEERAAFRSLMEEHPEARVLAAELRQVTRLLNGVGEREPPPHLRRAILAALPAPARASPESLVRRAVSRLRLITAHMEEAIMTRKTMIYGAAALAIVIAVASLVTGFPPLGGTAGTIGGDIPGVQQAARYRGRAMTQADVTLDNPEVKALLQNDQILRLVQSKGFRELMNNAAFRQLQSSEAYHELMSSEAYHELMSNEVYHELMSNELYHELMSSEAYHELQSSEAYRELMSNELYHELMSSELFRELHSSEAYHELMSNEVYYELMSSELFRELQSNEALRQLQNSELFRALSQNAELSEAFMSEAMRAVQ
jgi:hypothetical protein